MERGVGVLGQLLGPLLLLVEDGHEVGRVRFAQLDAFVVQLFLLQFSIDKFKFLTACQKVKGIRMELGTGST